jgi:hypothetical protein
MPLRNRSNQNGYKCPHNRRILWQIDAILLLGYTDIKNVVVLEHPRLYSKILRGTYVDHHISAIFDYFFGYLLKYYYLFIISSTTFMLFVNFLRDMSATIVAVLEGRALLMNTTFSFCLSAFPISAK